MKSNSLKNEVFKNQIIKQIDLNPLKYELNIIDFEDKKHLSSLWYGGKVATIKYKGYLFSLEANGDVKCSLFDKDNEEVARVKDKRNGACFFSVMYQYLKNDKEIMLARQNGGKFYKNNSFKYSLVFEDENWFEIFVNSPDGEFHDLSIVCDADNLQECIIEMATSMDEIIKYLEEDND